MNSATENAPVFDYRALRFIVGLVAFALPMVVMIISSTPLQSISGSYHTEARDMFVGAMFMIGGLLVGYNGHTRQEKWSANVAAIASMIAAIFPTACNTCNGDTNSSIHYAAAIVLFSAIAYFCLAPFRKNTKGQQGKKGRRATIYLVCGWIIIGCMVAVGVAKLVLPAATEQALAVTFIAEFVALWAFGVAWIVSGKVIPALVDEEDRLNISLF